VFLGHDGALSSFVCLLQASRKLRHELVGKHSKAFEKRPSNLPKRKGEAEVKELVGQVQRLRSEHDKLMKKLHDKEVHSLALRVCGLHFLEPPPLQSTTTTGSRDQSL
jgi:hypothetical protein